MIIYALKLFSALKVSWQSIMFAMLVACLLNFISLTPTIAQSTNISIAAIVNGKPITNIELNERMKFARNISNINITDTILRRETLESLITERIKIDSGQQIIGDIVSQVQQPARALVNRNFAKNGKAGIEALRDLGITRQQLLTVILLI